MKHICSGFQSITFEKFPTVSQLFEHFPPVSALFSGEFILSASHTLPEMQHYTKTLLLH